MKEDIIEAQILLSSHKNFKILTFDVKLTNLTTLFYIFLVSVEALKSSWAMEEMFIWLFQEPVEYGYQNGMKK